MPAELFGIDGPLRALESEKQMDEGRADLSFGMRR
jgi:hypothetical protein